MQAQSNIILSLQANGKALLFTKKYILNTFFCNGGAKEDSIFFCKSSQYTNASIILMLFLYYVAYSHTGRQLF